MGEYDRGNLFVFAVTPCVGVWIEIVIYPPDPLLYESLPVWECGLKSAAAVWDMMQPRHSLCGSVD